MARKPTDIIADIQANKPVLSSDLQLLADVKDGQTYIDYAMKHGLIQQSQAQPFANWFQGGQASNPQQLIAPDEKNLGKIVDNLNIQRPYPQPKTVTAPQNLEGFNQNPTDPDRGRVPNVGGTFDQNSNGVADYNDAGLAQPGQNANGDATLTFTMAQLQQMLAGFTQHLINPNSNIDGAPQTEWNTQNSADQQAAIAQAQQINKDRALAALAAMKNS